MLKIQKINLRTLNNLIDIIVILNERIQNQYIDNIIELNEAEAYSDLFEYLIDTIMKESKIIERMINDEQQ